MVRECPRGGGLPLETLDPIRGLRERDKSCLSPGKRIIVEASPDIATHGTSLRRHPPEAYYGGRGSVHLSSRGILAYVRLTILCGFVFAAHLLASDAYPPARFTDPDRVRKLEAAMPEGDQIGRASWRE